MTQKLFSLLSVIAILAAAPLTLSAHHSASAEFDRNQPIEFTGTVKVVEWVNPHGYVQVEVKEADGKTKIYRVEIMAPNGLYRDGWTKTSVKPGETVEGGAILLIVE